MKPRPAHEVMREIRGRLSDDLIAALRDDDLAYVLQLLDQRNAADVPRELIEEYARSRLLDHFPPAEPRFIERRRAVRRLPSG